jgi:hypothetical protein
MNCLETGPYVLAVIGCAWLYLRWTREPRQPWSIGRSIIFGLALGLTFWVRNDAVFLVAAACLVHTGAALLTQGLALRRRLVETIVFGATSVVVALPWVIHNYVRFGSPVPISGRAESYAARFAGSLYLVPVKLSEYLRIDGGVPDRFESHPLAIGISALTVVLALLLAVASWRYTIAAVRRLYALVGLYGFFLCTYYGLLFGAPHFMARYLMPLSPFLILWTTAMLAHAWLWASRSGRQAWVAVPAAVAILGVIFLGNIREYHRGSSHMHFHVKGWIDNNVPEDVWVGAIQTGTIGFFHERTLNLDGKVNPEALKANLARRLPQYVIDSPIQYIADWVGIADWGRPSYLGKHFEVIVNDKEANLAVLRRKAPEATAHIE